MGVSSVSKCRPEPANGMVLDVRFGSSVEGSDMDGK
jgi:hypothetical protein